jgi:hypothetical protein
MNSFLALFRANPGLIVAVALFLGTPLVLALVGLILRVAGASLRPIVFMAVLMAPLALVFLAAELVRARHPAEAPETAFNLTVRDGQFADRATLFGADVPVDQIRDAKAVFPEFFGEAEHAELGLVGTGESVLIAQFRTAEAAARAAKLLWQFFRVSGSSGDEESGWRGKRELNGDYFEMLRTGRHLFLWTALTREACAARRAASAGLTGSIDSAAGVRKPVFAALQPLDALFQPIAVKLIGMLIMVAFYVIWFFKGAAWAGSVPPAPDARPIPAAELASRLQAINALDVPFRIERGAAPNEWIADWRYADAKWLDHARAHGLRRAFRIRMTLDEASHTVRSTDYTAGFDWSAGADGARIEWQAAMGIVFFQTERRRVFGLQLDEEGRLRPELSYSYKFDLREMKSPLIDAVTRAGWTWRPTVWQGPVWLRWLTE